MAHVAIILGDDYEDTEFTTPRTTLLENNHRVDVIGVEAQQALTGKKGDEYTVDTSVAAADSTDYDALIIPGGYSPDHLRTNEEMVEFTRQFAEADKPIAAICHAGSMLIEADVVGSKTVTSWPSIKTDLVNAGANWVDEEVVVDSGLITSRNPDDLPVFMTAVLAAIGDVDGASKLAAHS